MSSALNYKELMWESWHYRFGLAGEGQADVIQNFLERYRGVVLNVGCGLDGAKLARLAAHCNAQVALDKDRGMVKSAESTCSANNVAFLVADAHDLPFRDCSADHVVALGLFAYMSDAARVLREFHRVCRRGGHVMITNSVSRSREHHRKAGVEAGLCLVEEMEGYCPAASGDIKRRYLLVFSRT
jgi:ubiquinone/menaquinone biosynthesis C-methylase UbiE